MEWNEADPGANGSILLGLVAAEEGRVMSSCPICAGIFAAEQVNLENGTNLHTIVVESFFTGVVTERLARSRECHVSSMMCAEHLKQLRVLASKVPLEMIDRTHRHILNLGLEVVKDSG